MSYVTSRFVSIPSRNFSTKVGNGLSLGEKKKPAPKDAFGGVLNNGPRCV